MLGSKSKIMKSNESSPISQPLVLGLVWCTACIIQREQLHHLKQKSCFSGANLEGWLVCCCWGACPGAGGCFGEGRGSRFGTGSDEVIKVACICCPVPGRVTCLSPVWEGGKSGSVGQTRRKQAGRMKGVDGGTPSCTEVPQRPSPHYKPAPSECTRYVKLTKYRIASKCSVL